MNLSTKRKKTIPPNYAQKVRTNPRYNGKLVCWRIKKEKEIIGYGNVSKSPVIPNPEPHSALAPIVPVAANPVHASFSTVTK